MIESGVTTVQHLAGWFAGSQDQIQDDIGRILQAYRDIGMRVSFSSGLRDQNRLVYQDDAVFAATLPAEVGKALSEHLATVSHPLEEQMQLFEELYQRHNGEERIRIQLAPVNLHWCSDRALGMMRDTSEKYQVPMHMHLLETAYQKEIRLAPRRRLGGGLHPPPRPPGAAHDPGPRGLAERGRHRPGCRDRHPHLSQCQLELAPAQRDCAAQRLRGPGMAVAMGMDEAGINDDRDMLQEMRMVLNLHREPGMDDRVPTAPQVLRMASEHGAHTTPFGSEIGTLQPGKAADLVLLKWEQIAYPFLDLDFEVAVLDAVVQRAPGVVAWRPCWWPASRSTARAASPGSTRPPPWPSWRPRWRHR